MLRAGVVLVDGEVAFSSDGHYFHPEYVFGRVGAMPGCHSTEFTQLVFA